MADIKISMLSKVKPVTEGMIVPMSYSPENNGVYKSGAITTDDIKSFVVGDLHLTYSTINYVDTAISNALTGKGGDVESIFASIEYVNSEDAKLSNRITTLEGINHSVYALKTDLATVDGKITAEVANATSREAKVLSDAKDYVTKEIGKLNVGQYATLSYVETVASKVDSTEAAINILNGEASVEGSVKKQVADAIAGVVASAPANFDTLKEIADYIAGEGGEAASLVNRISAVETAIDKEVKTDAPAREAKVLSDAKSFVTEEIGKLNVGQYATLSYVETVASKVDSTEAAINILNGEASVEGSVKKQVADAIAGVVASAPANFDTLKEIADYIAGEGGEAASLVNRISAVKTALDNEVNTYAPAREAQVLSDAKAYVNQKIAEIPEVDLTRYATVKWVTDQGYATTTALQEVGTLASAIASSYVAADKALSDRIDELKAKSDTHAAASVVNELSTKVSKIETAYVAADAALATRVSTLETESAKHAAADTVKTHINDGTIHVTVADKNKWNGAAAQTALDAAIARIAALEAKLKQYDARFGWNENVATGGEWGVNFLQID